MSGLFAQWLESVRGSAQAPAPESSSGEETATAAPASAASSAADGAAADGSPRLRAAKAAAPVLDRVLADAVDVARAALAEVVDPKVVGAHLGVVADGTRLVTHSFACEDPAYRGWHWIAVLARAPRAKRATVCETALLPGEDALVAPAWVPWEERLEPGDVGPKDVLPKIDDDPNLELGLEQTEVEGEELVDQVPNFEFGIGRRRVLSPLGLSNAAARWEASDSGADGDYAHAARAKCSGCGFLMPLAGSMRTRFGVCANAMSPFDGRVVSLDNGCGAHSETDVRRRGSDSATPVVDDLDEDFDTFDAGAERTADAEAPQTTTAAGAPQEA